MKVVVCSYKPEWKVKFNNLYQTIWPSIKETALSIQHVGSTSVEGLSAKDIIDLDIVIASYDEFPQIVEALKKLGYTHRGDLGIFQRESFIHKT
ncbi:MAG: GrpB family protein [Candidatus Cloacimonetes bacterium]|nr:GrpB family protein [Candidatus Cloacimonadota bacterium]